MATVDDDGSHGEPPVVVEVEPWGITIEVEPGETVFDAAHRQGWQWPTSCFGQARCTVCHMVVLDGADVVAPPDAVEAAMLDRLHRLWYRSPANLVLRLACRARPRGALRVEVARSPRRAGQGT